MGTKKDIGQAFKERISDFNDTPNTAVWEQIEAELNKDKKKDRLIIIWFRYGTVALALFLLAFLNRDYIAYFQYNTKSHKNNIEINEHDAATKTESDTNLFINNNSSPTNEHTILNDYNDSTYKVLTEKSTKPKTTSSNQTAGIITNRKRNILNSTNGLVNSKKSNSSDSNYIIDYNQNKHYEKISNESTKTPQEVSAFSQRTDSINAEKKLVENDKNESDDKTAINISDKDTITNQPKESKWSVFPNASLIYYDGFKKSYNNQITTNYGIYFTYQSSKKINIRLGVNKLQLQQTFTENNTLQMQNVEYFEIPLEFKYNFTQNKIQPYYIAGISYLFINDAELTLLQDNNSTTVSNKNTFARSTLSLNTGLGLQTKLYKRFYFNVECQFKYHFEPYSKSVDFHPYTISIIGGIEYKF